MAVVVTGLLFQAVDRGALPSDDKPVLVERDADLDTRRVWGSRKRPEAALEVVDSVALAVRRHGTKVLTEVYQTRQGEILTSSLNQGESLCHLKV